jgi:hypothetical protein
MNYWWDTHAYQQSNKISPPSATDCTRSVSGSVRLSATKPNVTYGSHGRSQQDLERADSAVWPRLNNLSTSALVGPRPTNDRKRQWF